MFAAMKHLFVTMGFLAAAGAPHIPRTSVQLLVLPDGQCTTWSVNQAKGYWVTDNHCIDHQEGLGSGTIQGLPTTVVKAWDDLDLAVLTGPHAPALAVAEDMPNPGTKIFKWGYGESARPWLSKGTTSRHVVFTPLVEHLLWIYDLEIRPGDSGAPVMTYDGTVVSVAEIYWPPDVQRRSRLLRSFVHPGAGLDTLTLYQALCPYLPDCTLPTESADDQPPATQN